MRTIIILCIAATLSGCAAYWDSQDPCQARNRGEGYQRPTFCGAGSGGTTYVTRDFRTNNIITTTRSRP
jgi:hypothetical protein